MLKEVKDVTDGRKTTSKGKVASYPVDDLQKRILHYGNGKKYNSQRRKQRSERIFSL